MVDSCSNEAILIFDESEIVKEMTYAEFQAILDNYVPLHDSALKTMDAVYVRIDGALNLTAAVFFRIPFDRQGFVERCWNIPLAQLVDTATTKGPDRGAGPIILVCQSKCSELEYQNELWEPTLEGPESTLVKIENSIKNNLLGVYFNKIHEGEHQHLDSTPAEPDKSEHTAVFLQNHQFTHRLLNTQAEQERRQLSLDHQQQVLHYQKQLNDYQQQLNEQLALNLDLKEKVMGQADKIEGMRDYFEAKLQVAQSSDEQEFESLKEHYESELLLQVESAVTDYKSELKARDVELLYRNEREMKLQQEILDLQRENQRLLDASKEEVLCRLNEAGINFVIYHRVRVISTSMPRILMSISIIRLPMSQPNVVSMSIYIEHG